MIIINTKNIHAKNEKKLMLKGKLKMMGDGDYMMGKSALG